MTLSYDYSLRVSDAQDGTSISIFENPNGCPFTDLDYVEEHTQVLLVDQHGYVFVYDLQKEALITYTRLVEEPIKSVRLKRTIIGTASDGAAIFDEYLVLLCKDQVQFWRIERDVDYCLLDNGHTGKESAPLSYNMSVQV